MQNPIHKPGNSVSDISPDSFSLTGKRALVTGASQGIGFAIAKAMAVSGAEVVLVAFEEIEIIQQATAAVKSTGANCWGYSFDLSILERIESYFHQITQECGSIDILVNCAGTTVREAAENISLEQWDRVMRLNLSSVFFLSQAFARACIANHNSGNIINIASLMSEAARPSTAAYTASKGGIRQLTKALAVDWAKYGIRVNAIGPGYIQTPFTEALSSDEQFDAWVKKRTPLGRWGEPVDIAGAAVFLASSAAAFITGQVLYVDGGWLSTF